jgi:hypothetical protein
VLAETSTPSLRELALVAEIAPARVLLGQAAAQLPALLGDRGSTAARIEANGHLAELVGELKHLSTEPGVEVGVDEPEIGMEASQTLGKAPAHDGG